MYLILHIEDKNTGSWILDDKVYDFQMELGSDSLLAELDKFKVDFKKLTGIALAVKDASLTQVKIFTTIINTLAWNFDLPVVGHFYFKKDFNKILAEIKTGLATKKKFKPLKVEYSRPPDITISKKQPKYKIIK